MDSDLMPSTQMALVPAGEFQMGDPGGREDERPVHRVYVSAFRMAVCPVTNREYAAFLEATAHEEPRFWNQAAFTGPLQPVVGVSWFDAVAYCDWFSSKTAREHRLPTEAEREKAARGGREGPRYPWGDEPPADGGRSAQDASNSVGQTTPNGFGLFDMGHNVHEWCLDWYDPAYYGASAGRDPRGPATGTRRASRGGAWRHQIKISRCAARSSLPPSFRYNDYGFRIVMPE